MSRPTPETAIVIHGVCFEQKSKFAELVALCQSLEQERDKQRQRADYLANEHKDLIHEYTDVVAALRVRIANKCDDCGRTCCGTHATNCRHFATEWKVMGGEPGYAPGDC